MSLADQRDLQVRLAVFAYLRSLSEVHGDVLPWKPLSQGIEIHGQRVPLLGPQGIFKPAVLPEVPLSIYTAPIVPGRPRPYEDSIEGDGTLRYKYRGTDPMHHDNVGLRLAMARKTPLVYFHGIAKGLYFARWPVYVVGDDRPGLTFLVQVDDVSSVLETSAGDVAESGVEARRAYITRVAVQRLHQTKFRENVLRAYREACAVCRLRHRELLDAAHILGDKHPQGEPLVSNGLALCKLHHAAFDGNFLGIRPDLVVEVRSDILQESDGPMLQHGLQGCHERPLLVLPHHDAMKPNKAFLEERFEEFRRSV